MLFFFESVGDEVDVFEEEIAEEEEAQDDVDEKINEMEIQCEDSYYSS